MLRPTAAALCAFMGLHSALDQAHAQMSDSRLIRQGELRLPGHGGVFKRPKFDKPLKHGTLAPRQPQHRSRLVFRCHQALSPRPLRHQRTSPDAHRLHCQTQGPAPEAPKGSVFEDLVPRLADVDGDGEDEIIVVRSYITRGAALAVAKVYGRTLAIIAETPPIGITHRWLNPAGIADFDGDGKNDIALVVTPHIRGDLQIWTLNNRKLEMLARTDDISNHVYGSRQLGLSAVADFNADGRADLAIPDQQRRYLRFLTLRGGKLRNLGEKWLRVPAKADFQIVKTRGKIAVRVGLPGGRGITVSPCRDISDWQMAKGHC